MNLRGGMEESGIDRDSGAWGWPTDSSPKQYRRAVDILEYMFILFDDYCPAPPVMRTLFLVDTVLSKFVC